MLNTYLFLGTCEGCNRRNTGIYEITQMTMEWPLFSIYYCIDCKKELQHAYPCCLK